MCCCKTPDGDLRDHDESNKFKLKSLNKEDEKMVIFGDVNEGELLELNDID